MCVLFDGTLFVTSILHEYDEFKRMQRTWRSHQHITAYLCRIIRECHIIRECGENARLPPMKNLTQVGMEGKRDAGREVCAGRQEPRLARRHIEIAPPIFFIRHLLFLYYIPGRFCMPPWHRYSEATQGHSGAESSVGQCSADLGWLHACRRLSMAALCTPHLLSGSVSKRRQIFSTSNSASVLMVRLGGYGMRLNFGGVDVLNFGALMV